MQTCVCVVLIIFKELLGNCPTRMTVISKEVLKTHFIEKSNKAAYEN
jgi:hypothetical protein